MSDERGQATIETMLLTFVIITFVAAAYQVFVANQAIYGALSTVHAKLFERAFARNCSEARGNGECEYSTDPSAEGFGGTAARVIWSPKEIPQVEIPVIGIFKKFGLDDVRLYSDRRLWSSADEESCPGGKPCKRTKIGAGTYKGPIDGILLLERIDLAAAAGLTAAQVRDSLNALNALGFLGNVLFAAGDQ